MRLLAGASPGRYRPKAGYGTWNMTRNEFSQAELALLSKARPRRNRITHLFIYFIWDSKGSKSDLSMGPVQMEMGCLVCVGGFLVADTDGVNL
jgi:hypothetical protein